MHDGSLGNLYMIDRPTALEHDIQATVDLSAVRSIGPQSRTSLVEHSLLFMAMVTLPLENHLPTVLGMSASFLIFAALGGYVIVNRQRALAEVWCNPIFISAYAFIAVAALLEFSSPLSRYGEIVRFAQMIGGALCVAVLCRDRSGLTVGLCGCIGAALWVSVVFYLTSYGMLQGMGAAEDFHQASRMRQEVWNDKVLEGNINTMGFVCAQGAIVAFALSLSNRLKYLRILCVGLSTFCLVAAFLPMSRGAVVISFVSAALVLHAHGVKQGKALILASILGLGIYVLVPDSVWSRMAFSTETGESGKMEGRAYIYTTALNHLPEYLISGVGSGNFYGRWGAQNGFFRGSGNVLGAHNSFLQITIFWGVLGLFMFMWMLWLIYRSIPLRCGRDELSLALLGLLASLGLMLLDSHLFFNKWFSFGIGMLVGARRWIWPTGIVLAIEEEAQSSLYQRK